MPTLPRSLSFSCIEADLSRCGQKITPVELVNSLRGIKPNNDTHLAFLTGENPSQSGSQGQLVSGNTSPVSGLGNLLNNNSTTNFNLSGTNPRKRKRTMSPRAKMCHLNRGKAFPFGTSEFPYQPQRLGGGSVNATTKIFALKTKTPMGQAGMRVMFGDARFTHIGNYAVDSRGSVNFYNCDKKSADKAGDDSDGGGAIGSVFDKIEVPKVDDMDRLIGKDCRVATFHE